MAVAITRITPGRGRAGDSIAITGSGFSAAAGRNGVTVGGIAATVTAEDDESITVTVPTGVATDKHLDVVVSNLTDSTAATHRWWSKASLATLRALRLPVTVHGGIEASIGATAEAQPEVAQARDWERVIGMLEVLPWDVLTSKGRIAARATTGLVSVAAGTAGQRYTRDKTTTGGSWRTRAQQCLSWGRAFATTDTTETLLPANASDAVATSQGEGQVVLAAGKLAIISIMCRRGTPVGSDITRVRVFVNGVAGFDSNNEASTNIPSVRAGEVWAAYPWLTVAAGDRLTVGLTKSNGTSAMNLVAKAMVF